jgi:hypothetical protein
MSRCLTKIVLGNAALARTTRRNKQTGNLCACDTKLLLVSLLLTLLPAAVQAQFTYTTNNGSITITGYTGPGGAVTIPGAINSLPVTTIGMVAFYFKSVTSVTIPDSVTNIGEGAFSFCTNLTNVRIGNSVSSIGDFAFYYCDSLASVTITSHVTSIGVGTFDHCISLARVTLPNSLTTIENSAFYFCISLTNVTIPDSVSSISYGAFEHCTSLASVTIPSSVTVIRDYAFSECASLTAITVDALNAAYSSVEGVLLNHSKTTLIQFPGGKAGTYTIPNSVTTIANYAFSDCDGLTTVTIPDSVTTIGRDAFVFCTNLTTVRFGNSVTSIGDEAFFYCIGLASVTIPSSVTSIGDQAFFYCISLASVTIPNSVTYIGEGAFYYCYSLTSVTIPHSVTKIGSVAFANCTGLTNVFFKGNAPSEDGTFLGDYNATIYYLPGTIGWGLTFGGRPAVLLQSPVADASATQPIVISANGIEAMVVLDGSLSIDPAGESLAYAWYEVDNDNAVAGGAVAVVLLPVGVHSLLLVVNDGFLSATNAFAVDVVTRAQAVGRLIDQVDSRWPRSRPLVATLSAVLASIERGTTGSAINELLAFQKQARAQVSPLDAALAENFIQKAQEIIANLSQ